MSASDYLTTFYSVIAGLTATIYVQKWGELLQMRRYAIYTTVPILWSICFFLMILNEWFSNFRWAEDTNAFLFLISLLIPFILYFIGMLIFPSTDMLDRKDKYAYLDYFEHFRQQKTLIMSMALLVFLMDFFSAWHYNKTDINVFNGFFLYLVYKRNYLVFGVLIATFLTENKLFLMLLSLILFYVWATTWIYAHLM